MASALIALANATAAFTVAGQGVTTDPDTGNVMPVEATLSYQLFLKAVDVDPTAFPGVDYNGTVYEGYAVEPTDLDARIAVGSTGLLTFGTAQPVRFEVVKARMGYGDVGALGATLAGALGTRLRLLTQE
jgi:hypothetical protein